MAIALPIERDRDRPAPPLLLAEAGLAMLGASLAIRLKPFDKVIAEDALAERDLRAASADQAYWIRRVVSAWGRRLPWRAKCFEKGLAAAWMLRRRRLAANIHYGIAKDEADLDAHVWVTSGEVDVVGHEAKDAFTEVGRF